MYIHVPFSPFHGADIMTILWASNTPLSFAELFYPCFYFKKKGQFQWQVKSYLEQLNKVIHHFSPIRKR
jgi:hypothetical protein